MQVPFSDREEAGEALARQLEAIEALRARPAVVLALPRGGVPVARPVARRLGAPLDVLVARKIGMPDQLELAIGAVTARGIRVLNDELLRHVLLPPGYLHAETERQRAIAAERERVLRQSRPEIPLEGRIAILVDDGIATGMTMRAAIADVRARGPASVVVAAPVVAPRTRDELSRLADRVVALEAPEGFWAVGQFYGDFGQVSDLDVIRQLAGTP